MRIESVSEENYILYLNQDKYKIKITSDKKELAKYFKDLLQVIKQKYQIDIHGYYELEIYRDINYGMIVELNKVSDDYFDLFNHKVDLRIIYHKQNYFLYELEDLELLKEFAMYTYQVYYYDNRFFVCFKNKVTEFKKYLLLEHTRMVYGEMKDKILTYAKELFSNEKK